MNGIVCVLLVALAVYSTRCQAAHPTRTRKGPPPSQRPGSMPVQSSGGDIPTGKPKPKRREQAKQPPYTSNGGLPVSGDGTVTVKQRPPTRTKTGHRPQKENGFGSSPGWRRAGKRRFDIRWLPTIPPNGPTYRHVSAPVGRGSTADTVPDSSTIGGQGLSHQLANTTDVIRSYVKRRKRGIDRRYNKRHFTKLGVIPKTNTDLAKAVGSLKAKSSTIKNIASPATDTSSSGIRATFNVYNNIRDRVLPVGYTPLPKSNITVVKAEPTVTRHKTRYSDILTGTLPNQLKAAFIQRKDSRTKSIIQLIKHGTFDIFETHKTVEKPYSAVQNKGLSTSDIMKEILFRLSANTDIKHGNGNSVTEAATTRTQINSHSITRRPSVHVFKQWKPQNRPIPPVPQTSVQQRIAPMIYVQHPTPSSRQENKQESKTPKPRNVINNNSVLMHKRNKQTHPRGRSATARMWHPIPPVTQLSAQKRMSANAPVRYVQRPTLGSRQEYKQESTTPQPRNVITKNSVLVHKRNTQTHPRGRSATARRRYVYIPPSSGTNNTRHAKLPSTTRRTWRYHTPYDKQEAVGDAKRRQVLQNTPETYDTSRASYSETSKQMAVRQFVGSTHKPAQDMNYTRPKNGFRRYNVPLKLRTTAETLSTDPHFMKSIQAYIMNNKNIISDSQPDVNETLVDKGKWTYNISNMPSETANYKAIHHRIQLSPNKANVAQNELVTNGKSPSILTTSQQENNVTGTAKAIVQLRSSPKAHKVTLAKHKATFEELGNVVNAIRVLQNYMNSETTSSIFGMINEKPPQSKGGADCKLCNILKLLVGLNCQIPVAP